LLAGLLFAATAPGLFPGAGPGRLTFGLCGSAALLCAVGVWDDRNVMRARSKFLWQILAIALFVHFGRPTESVSAFHWQITSPALTIPLILLWLVACSNFINLLDGLDGLAGSLGLIITLTVAVLAAWQAQPETLVFSLVLAGSLLGFLVHNWPPARIFMGDCGSLPLGFLVGALALETSAKKAAGLTLVVPAVLLAVPLIDTSMAIVRRKLSGRKIGHGDRGHIHHCLGDRGLSPRQTLLAVCSLSLFTAAGAVAATIVGSDLLAAAIGGLLLTLLSGARVFGFRETLLVARHLEAVWSLVRWFPQALRTRLLAVRLGTATAKGELLLWEKIIRRARRMEIVEVEFTFEPTGIDRSPQRLHWTTDHSKDDDAQWWETRGSVARGPLGKATFRVRGASPRGDMVGPNAEFTELLATLCRNWTERSADSALALARTREQPVHDPDLTPAVVKLPAVDAEPGSTGDRIHRDAA